MAVKMQLSTDTMQSIANLNKLCSSLEKTAGALNKATDGFKSIKKAMDNNTSSISSMTKAMEAVKSSTAKASAEIKDVSSNTKEASKDQKELGKEGQKTTTTLSTGFKSVSTTITLTLGTIKKMISSIKNVASKIQDLVKPQAQYIEDLNFLDNAYGRADSSGKKLLDTLEKTVGYDPAKLVQTAATFRQLGNALDMDSDIADTLANNLIKLSVDVKSITGQDLGDVTKKFQSAMAGNIRAVRAYGVDVTQAALQQELLRLGIDRQISSLNRAEKSVLTYITMSRQLSVANGDLSRTVNSVGNQWEIFQNQIAELGRLVGGFFIPILKGILPVLNGIIMALNTIISMIMSFFGIDAEAFSKEFGATATSIDDNADAFDNMANSAGKASKAAKEAQKSLRGFDKLNNITTPTKSSGSGGSSKTSLGGGIDPRILKGLKDYDLHLEGISNWATKIRDKIMQWLGFTKVEDKQTGKISYKYRGIHTTLKNMYKTFEDNPLSRARQGMEMIIAPWMFFISKMKEALIMNDNVWNAVQRSLKETKKVLEPLYNLVAKKVIPDVRNGIEWLYKNVIKPFSDFLDGVFADIWLNIIIPAWEEINREVLPPLIEGLDTLWNDILVPLGNFIKVFLKPMIEGVVQVLKILWENILQPFISFLSGVVLGKLKDWAQRFEAIAKFGNDIRLLLVNLWDNVLKPFWKWLEPKYTWVKTNIIDNMLKPVYNILKNIKTTFIELKNVAKNFTLGNALNKFLQAFGITKSTSTGSGSGKAFATGGIWNNGIWSPVKTYARGGFPSRGEIFMARETKGPELVGKIGSSTAILNNDQILEQMTIAVARGIAASGSKGTNVNIVAEADTEGLLNFINFKNASKNRQYGL